MKSDVCCLNKGFTLIELMVSASIIGIIGLVILTTFGSGFHVYERVQTYGVTQADALFALEEIEKNLRNVFPFSAIGFEGDAQRIAFPTIIEKLETVDEEEYVVSSIGKIVYYLDEADDQTKTLMSERQDYSQAVAEVKTEEDQGSVLAFIKDIQFSYYSFDEESQEYAWKDSWDREDENLPPRVKIALTFQDGSRDVQLVRTVLIPAIREIKEEDLEEGDGEGEGEE